MKICVAGQGAFGQKHLDALKRIPGAEVVSLIGGSAADTEQVAKKYGISHWGHDLGEGIKRADAVILATPTKMHFKQAEQVMRNLTALLRAAGASFTNVVRTTVYLADMNDFAAMNEVYSRYIVDPPPARATVKQRSSARCRRAWKTKTRGTTASFSAVSRGPQIRKAGSDQTIP